MKYRLPNRDSEEPNITVSEVFLRRLTSPKTALFLGELLFRFMRMRKMLATTTLSNLKNVLIVRLDEIGDVVLTIPFLRELRRNIPNAWITLVVKPAVFNLVEPCPYVNEVLTFDPVIFGSFRKIRRYRNIVKSVSKYLWHRQFDLSIVPRWDVDDYHASFLSYFSGARRRVGYSENVSRCKQYFNKSYDILFTHVFDNKVVKHELERNLDLILYLGGIVYENRLELWISEKDEALADQVMKSHPVGPNDLIVAIGAGAGHPKRMWPIDNFVEIGKWLKKEHHARLLIFRGKQEEPLYQKFLQEIDDTLIKWDGQTTLRQTCALLKRCHIYIGNDSGLMHMAAALGLPVIEISCHPIDASPNHPNSPIRFGPWNVPNRIIQPKKASNISCNADHCINNVTVDQVKSSIDELLKAFNLYESMLVA